MALPSGQIYEKVYADQTLEYKPDHEFEKPENFMINLNCDEGRESRQAPADFEDFF
jgi:penicillin-binding protein 1A